MRVGFVRNVGLVALSLAVAAVAACNDDPLSSSDKDDTTHVFTNPSVMTIAAGVPVKLVSVAQNNLGEPTWETVTPNAPSCASIVEDPDRLVNIQPPGLFVVTGNSAVSSCVIELSAGSATADVAVTVIGDALTLVCPTGVRAGDSGTMTAALVDADGNPMGPFDSTMDLEWSSDAEGTVAVDQAGNWTSVASGSAVISVSWDDPTGVATLTTDCVIEVGGDVPFEAAFADADTLGSIGTLFFSPPADPTAYDVTVFDVNGNPTFLESEITGITATTDDPGIATAVGIREVPEGSGEALLSVAVTPVSSGTVTISGTVQTTEGNLPFSGVLDVVLIPTLTAATPATGVVGEVITLDVENYDPALNTVFINGNAINPLFIESESPTQVVFWWPNVAVTSHEIAVGATSEALSGVLPFEQTSTASADDPDYLLPTTAPLTALPLKKVSYLSASVLDHFYRIDVAAPTTIVIDLDWDSGSDLDILVYDSGLGFVCFDGATGAQPEQSVCDLPAAGTYYIDINDYDATNANYVLEAAVQ